MISWGPKIETSNNPTPQLYDLSMGEYEKDNVANENPNVVYELQNVLRRERAKKRWKGKRWKGEKVKSEKMANAF